MKSPKDLDMESPGYLLPGLYTINMEFISYSYHPLMDKKYLEDEYCHPQV